MNKVKLTGRIVTTPEIRYTRDGIPVVSFLIVTDRNCVDEFIGRIEGSLEFHRIVVVSQLAKRIQEKLKEEILKGKKLKEKKLRAIREGELNGVKMRGGGLIGKGLREKGLREKELRECLIVKVEGELHTGYWVDGNGDGHFRREILTHELEVIERGDSNDYLNTFIFSARKNHKNHNLKVIKNLKKILGKDKDFGESNGLRGERDLSKGIGLREPGIKELALKELGLKKRKNLDRENKLKGDRYG
jgi:hypothetical protein